jgi:hypothetical protein
MSLVTLKSITKTSWVVTSDAQEVLGYVRQTVVEPPKFVAVDGRRQDLGAFTSIEEATREVYNVFAKGERFRGLEIDDDKVTVAVEPAEGDSRFSLLEID